MARSVRRISGLLVTFMVVASAATAADGVIEINQARALAGDVTPGDGPGFPVTLSAPGSYRLTGNLSVPASTTAIRIEAIDVTLDLGGFEVAGPNVCTGYPTQTCTTFIDGVNDDADAPPGIRAESGAFLAVVRNGSVRGMAGFGIFLEGASSTVDRVRVLSSGASGIWVGGMGRVVDCFSGSNWISGINLGGGATAERNEVRANRSVGIWMSDYTRPGSVIENRVFDNGVLGISLSADLASRNVIGSAIDAFSFGPGAKSLGDDLCGDHLC
jgi:hypothetical protein